MPVKQSHWALITNEVIPGSRDMPYVEQCALSIKIADDTGINYLHLPLMEGVVSVLCHYLDSGKKLYPGCSYARTSDLVYNSTRPAVFGCFCSTGLCVFNDYMESSIGKSANEGIALGIFSHR